VTDSRSSGAPAEGWYADPTGQAGVRWWNGSEWTSYTAPMPAAGPAAASGPTRATLPATTPVYTPYIWLVVLLPLLSIIATLAVRPEYRFTRVNGVRTIDPASVFTPAYIAVLLFGVLLYALMLLFCYLDYRALVRVGVERPFHWAWAFLASVVYVIGRSVIVHQVARPRGLLPVWITIGVVVVSVVTGFVIGIATSAETLRQLQP
jgi:Protein of unknown function (DUF2510)